MVFDNFLLADLVKVLREDTVMARHYRVIPHTARIVAALNVAEIWDADTFLHCMEHDAEQLAVELTQSPDLLLCLRNILRFFRFRSRPIREFLSIDEAYRRMLLDSGIKNTKHVLERAALAQQRADLVDQGWIPREVIDKVVGMADLMRLPGIKDTRASLYYECGYTCLAVLARQQIDDVMNSTTTYIERNGMEKQPPLPKELSTSIAWAEIMPSIVDLGDRYN